MTETVFVIKKVFVIMMGLNSPMLSAELGVKYDKIDHTVGSQNTPVVLMVRGEEEEEEEVLLTAYNK